MAAWCCRRSPLTLKGKQESCPRAVCVNKVFNAGVRNMSWTETSNGLAPFDAGQVEHALWWSAISISERSKPPEMLPEGCVAVFEGQ